MTAPANETIGPLQDCNYVPTRLRVLILEDNQRDAELFIRKLQEAGFELDADTVDTEEAFVSSLRFRVYDLILSDYSIPEWSGLEAFRVVKRSGLNTPFVLVTGTLGEEAAVDLIKEGVTDYILKDRLTRLPSAVRRALDEKLTRDEAARARQALHDSEEKVRLLLDSTAEAIYGVNLQGDCTFCNPACARLLGYDNPSDLLGEQMHSLSHHTRAEGTPYSIVECPICMAIRAGRGIHLDEELLRKKDGSTFPAECWSHPMLQDGKSIGSVVTFLDITERKQIEDNLRRVAAVVESSQDAIISVTLDGIILTWNLGAEQIYGYLRAEILGKSLAIIVPPDWQSALEAILKKISWGEKVEQLETICVRNDGKHVPVSLSVSSIKDVTERLSVLPRSLAMLPRQNVWKRCSFRRKRWKRSAD